MIIKNNSTTRTYGVGPVILYPLDQKTVPDEYYNDITSNADLQLIGGIPANPNHIVKEHTMAVVDQSSGVITSIVTTDGDTGFVVNVVSSSAPNDGDGRPNGTIYIQTA